MAKRFQGLPLSGTVPASFTRPVALDITPGLPNAVLQTNSGGTQNSMNVSPDFTSLSVGGNALPVMTYSESLPILQADGTDLVDTGVTATVRFHRTGNLMMASLSGAFTVSAAQNLYTSGLYIPVPPNYRVAAAANVRCREYIPAFVDGVETQCRVYIRGDAGTIAPHHLALGLWEGSPFPIGKEIEVRGFTLMYSNDTIL